MSCHGIISFGNLSNHALQDFARTALREIRGTGCNHVLHLLRPTHRSRELGNQVSLYFFCIRMSLCVYVLVYGTLGVLNVVASMAACSSSLAGCIKGEWNAPPTGNKSARLAPAAFSFSHAALTASTLPLITNCPGQL